MKSENTLTACQTQREGCDFGRGRASAGCTTAPELYTPISVVTPHFYTLPPFHAQIGTSAVSARARRAPTDPSAVAARLRVVSSSRRLAEPLTGTAAHSHSAYSCPGDCLPHVCRLRNNVDHVLRWTAEVNFGLKRVGASRPPRPGFRSEDASMRPEAQFHASSAAFPSHAAPVAVC